MLIDSSIFLCSKVSYNLSFSLPVVVEFSDIKTFSIDSRGSLNVYSNHKLRVTL